MSQSPATYDSDENWDDPIPRQPRDSQFDSLRAMAAAVLERAYCDLVEPPKFIAGKMVMCDCNALEGFSEGGAIPLSKRPPKGDPLVQPHTLQSCAATFILGPVFSLWAEAADLKIAERQHFLTRAQEFLNGTLQTGRVRKRARRQ